MSCSTTACAAPFAAPSSLRLHGQQAAVDFDSIARALYPQGFAHAWQTVPCIENHDIVKVGTDQRIPISPTRPTPVPGMRAAARGSRRAFCSPRRAFRSSSWDRSSWKTSSGDCRTQRLPNLLWWDGLNTRSRSGDGESSALHPGSHPPALESAGPARRQRQSISCSRCQPRDRVSSLDRRHRAGCRRRRHSLRDHLV